MDGEFPWRTGRSCIFANTVDLVFITKFRRGVFSQEMLSSLKTTLTETCTQMGAQAIAFSGEDDHICLRVDVPPKLAIATLVGKLKGKSSYVLRRDFAQDMAPYLWSGHLWSPSYCAFSCGDPQTKIQAFIDAQRLPTSEANARRAISRNHQKSISKILAENPPNQKPDATP